MKRIQAFIPLLLLIMLALTVTPALATKEKTEKIKYTLLGYVYGPDQGGRLSLSFNGRIVGTPDYEEEKSWVNSGVDVSDTMFWEEWTENGVRWQAVVYLHREDTWTESNSLYGAKWYSPQPTFHGQLVIIWEDGTATTFKASLDVLWIEKSGGETTTTHMVTDNYYREIYWWDEVNWMWVFDRTETYVETSTWSSTYVYSEFHIAFSGKIQSGGGPPIEGTFYLWDYKGYYNYLYGWGKFGPYLLYVGT